MKVFKTLGFKYIFYLELTLIFSAFLSVLIFFFFNLLKTQPILYQDPYKDVYDHNNKLNYQIFNQLLSIKIDPADNQEEVNSKFISALKRLENIENTLKRRGNIDVYQLILDIPRDFSIIKQKKEYIYLRWLYLKRRYEEFIIGYPKVFINKDELDLLYINSLMKLNQPQDALGKFKILFKNKNLNSIRKMISAKDLKFLIDNLDRDYWESKLFYMLDRNRYTEYRRIKGFIKDLELLT